MKLIHIFCLTLLNYNLLMAQVSISSDSLRNYAIQPYFYHGQNYGSESQFGPINIFSNFDMTYSNHISSEFLKALNKVETWSFFQDEIIPLFEYKGIWNVNHQLHIIRKGLVYRKLAEKHQYDHILSPKTLAVFSIIAAQIMDQSLKKEVSFHQNSNALTDFWYTLAGITLFTFEPVAEIFTDNIQINYWPGQNIFTQNEGTLINHMEMYAWKIHLGSWTSKRLFIGSGLPSTIGVSSPQDKENTYSYVMGLNAGDAGKGYVQEKQYQHAQFAGYLTSSYSNIYPMLGWFWDKKESLMLRVLLGYSSTLHLDISAYPGVFHMWDYPIGGYVLATGFFTFFYKLHLESNSIILQQATISLLHNQYFFFVL